MLCSNRCTEMLEVHLLRMSQRSITVINFGGDGDSQILRAMKVSYEFKLNAPNDKQQFDLLSSSLLKVPNTKQ